MTDTTAKTRVPALRPELVEIVRKIRALRTVTAQTGFLLNRTIGTLLAKLPTEDLVAIGEALQLKPQDFQHYIR